MIIVMVSIVEALSNPLGLQPKDGKVVDKNGNDPLRLLQVKT